MGDPSGFLKQSRSVPRALPVVDRVRHHNEHYERFSDAQIQSQASRCMACGVPFCMSGCPLGNPIPDFNDAVHSLRWSEALDRLLNTNNFPEFTGRICPAPCETACVLGIIDDPVAIKLSEQEISDRGWAEGLITARAPSVRTGKTVAIVGSGPAGLACAQQLNRVGHRVTIFERHDRAGGLLMYGIPNYKLDKGIVTRRVEQLQAEGITFRFGAEVGVDVEAEALRNEFDAVVIATGSEIPRDLEIEGRQLRGIHFAMEYLPQSNRRNLGDDDPAALHADRQVIDAAGLDVIVIGGGDTGSDCIGTAIRQGAKSVTNFELMPEPPSDRTVDNPWPQWSRIKRISTSVDELWQTGGAVEYSIATRAFVGTPAGDVTGLQTVRLNWNGSKPIEVPNSIEAYPADLVLLAMGYTGPRQGILKQFGCSTSNRGTIETDGETRMSSVEGVFAAGDARRGQSLVVWAIAEGREVARCVDGWLMSQESLLPKVRLEPFAY